MSLGSFLENFAVDVEDILLGWLASKRIRSVAQMGAIPSRATGDVVVAAGSSGRALELDDAWD